MGRWWRILFGNAAILTIALVALYLWSPDSMEPVTGPADRADPEAARRVEGVGELLERAAAARDVGDREQETSIGRQVAEALADRVGKMMNIALDRVVPIRMYGRVVDQTGHPVISSRVWVIAAGGGAMAPGSGKTHFVTDDDGRFEVNARGQDLVILKVEHPELAPTRFVGVGAIGESITLQGASHFGDRFSWAHYDNEDNPYVIRVWRVERFEEVRTGGGYFEPAPNGRAFEAGGLIAECTRDARVPDVAEHLQTGSWSVTFRVVDGGIQPTDDYYLNEAPTDGYRPSVTVGRTSNTPDYAPRIFDTHRYYYRAHDGKWYGSLEVTFQPFDIDEVCMIPMEYKYNPNGSRNLALRPGR